MKVTLQSFQGIVPKLNARDIPPGVAASAKNARFEDGCIVPINGSATAHTFSDAVSTIILHNDTWRGFAGNVNAAPGPIASDRLYLTGDGVPSMFVEGVGRFDLKLPAPVGQLTITATGDISTVGSIAAADAQTAATAEYDRLVAAAGGASVDAVLPVATALNENPSPALTSIVAAYTYVTVFDEESPPSALSDNINWQSGQGLTVTGFVEPSVGRNIDRIRLYRSQTSALGVTDLYFVVEIPVAQSNYNHDIVAVPLGEFITSRDYDLPSDTMSGIVTLPNGMMAAFDGRSLRFCEPYIPHAWPLKYELTTEYDIVGLAAFGMTLCVLTTGNPYMVQGQTPDSMVMQKMEVNLPCVSARSVVDLGYAAAYASQRGLVIMSQAGPQIVTANLYTRNQWVNLAPETIRAAQIDGKYLFKTASGVFILNTNGAQPFIEEAGFDPIDLFFDITSSNIFYLEADGLTVKTYDDPSQPIDTYAEWTSGTLQLDHPISFGVVKADAQTLGCDDYLRVDVYGDDVLVGQTFEPNAVSRLTGDNMYTKWRVEILTNMKVERVIIAGSHTEIVQ
jgi:hypothetical protein